MRHVIKNNYTKAEAIKMLSDEMHIKKPEKDQSKEFVPSTNSLILSKKKR